MPVESKNKRKLRRVRRELTLTRRYLDIALAQRNEARLVAGALEKELRKHDEPKEPEVVPIDDPNVPESLVPIPEAESHE